MSKRKEEIISVAVILLIAIILTLRCWREEKDIADNKVYVIGYLKKSEFGGSENGWVYTFEYYFGSKKYTRTFTGPIKKYILQDSAIFLRVSSKYPSSSREIQDIRVPECLKEVEIPNEGWEAIPNCP